MFVDPRLEIWFRFLHCRIFDSFYGIFTKPTSLTNNRDSLEKIREKSLTPRLRVQVVFTRGNGSRSAHATVFWTRLDEEIAARVWMTPRSQHQPKSHAPNYCWRLSDLWVRLSTIAGLHALVEGGSDFIIRPLGDWTTEISYSYTLQRSRPTRWDNVKRVAHD